MGRDAASVDGIPVVILCGGEGTRLREETSGRPKPLVEIGEHPLLWHVMSFYAGQGLTDFILCLGYKGDMIKEYFLSHEIRTRDFVLRLGDGAPRFLSEALGEGWTVTCADTGLHTMTGGRLKRIEKYVMTPHFMVTYADGLADIDLRRLWAFHREHGGIATVTGVRAPSPFGELVLDGTRVVQFSEKPQARSVINGGFFVFRREVFKYLDDDDGCVLERAPLERLAAEGELHAFRHDGFWQCLDTYKDQRRLSEIWKSGRAPWVIRR